MDVSDQVHATADLSSGTIIMTAIIIIIIYYKQMHGEICG